jgi:flagellar hook-associated protein FlgK
LIKDPAEVAGASKLMSSVAPTNLSATSADVALVSPRTATSQAMIDSVIPRSNGTTIESTLVAARSTPIAVIPAGYGDVALSSSIGGGELAIFTRDGRQLAGPDLSARATDIVSSANGFYAGAIFSAEYLNKTGEDAYLDQGFIFGQVASSSSQLDSAGNAQLTPATIVTDTVNGAAIATDGRLRVRINGESIDVAVAGSDLATIAAAINTQKVATGAVAEVIAVAETSVPAGNVVAGSSIKLTNAANTLVTISVDSRLGETDKSWAQNLARKINAANLGITATITGANLVLSKVSASDGTTFTVGANSIGMTTGAVDERSKLMFKSYQEIRFDTGAVDDNSFIYLNNQFDSSFGDHGITVDPVGSRPAGESAAQNLVRKINDAQLGVTASIDGTKIVLTNSAGQAGMPFTIGRNSLGLEEKTHFNDADLSIDFDPTVTTTQSLKNLGLRPGFVMREALGEDLLVFGVDASSGRASSVSISGSYSAGSPPAALATDTREYEIVFDATNGYEVIDSATETVVSAGVFDLTNRTISYGVWKTTFGGIPAGGDRFIIKPTVDALGDNRTASLIAQIQSRRDLLPSKQTLQEEYEGLVNRIGSLTVQAEIGQNAQKVVYDHAQQSRDRVSGVNLDEELSDLLRFQQAYQANAQVIQTANRIFDSLLQRL